MSSGLYCCMLSASLYSSPSFTFIGGWCLLSSRKESGHASSLCPDWLLGDLVGGFQSSVASQAARSASRVDGTTKPSSKICLSLWTFEDPSRSRENRLGRVGTKNQYQSGNCGNHKQNLAPQRMHFCYFANLLFHSSLSLGWISAVSNRTNLK